MNRNKLYSLSVIFLLIILNFQVISGIFSISQQEEIQLGKQAAMQVNKTTPMVKNKDVQAYINDLGQELVRNSRRRSIKYYFQVADKKEINAFALPGGYIYIHRGLIEAADNESELAGVVAHEIAHITQRHSAEQVERAKKAQTGMVIATIAMTLSGLQNINNVLNGANMLTSGYFASFSRDAEREADREGATMLYKAGYNPQGMVSFFYKLAKKGRASAGFFSTHPAPMERYHNVSNQIGSWKTSTNNFENYKVNSDQFIKIKALLTASNTSTATASTPVNSYNSTTRRPSVNNTSRRRIYRRPSPYNRGYSSRRIQIFKR